MAGVVIPIQTTDAGKEQVRQQLDNLGSQMSQLVQSYNALRADIEGKPSDPAVRDQFRALADQRKESIRQLVETFKAAAQAAAAQGIPSGVNVPALAGFRGLGADDLGGVQTAVATEQSKLSALAAYYQAAQAAIAAGQPVPPVPPELQSGSSIFGISTTMLLIGGAILLFFVMNKK